MAAAAGLIGREVCAGRQRAWWKTMDSLSDVLSNKPATETPATAPTPEVAPVASGDTAAPPAADTPPELVPLSALKDARKQKNDWKAKYYESEGGKTLLAQQIDALMKAPAATDQRTQPVADDGAMPDPFLDPEGYRKAVREEARREALAAARSERLHDLEEAAKEQHGKDEVEAAFARMLAAVEKNPSIKGEFEGSRNPWARLMAWDKKQKEQAEVGDDLDAYKKKLRAEWEAEQGGQPPSAAPSPAAPVRPPALNIPASLATTPSVQARSAPPFTGPTALKDILN